jgi:peptidoglycan/LPS O-acetylase OafA/YrhL
VPLEVALDFGVSLSAAWLVGCAVRGIRGPIGDTLELPSVTYVGTISYALYLFHGFMPYVLGRYVPGFVDMPWPMRALLLTAATFTVATLSWRTVEAPILRLKDKLTDSQAAPLPDRLTA